jgi:hypothetical protein
MHACVWEMGNAGLAAHPWEKRARLFSRGEGREGCHSSSSPFARGICMGATGRDCSLSFSQAHIRRIPTSDWLKRVLFALSPPFANTRVRCTCKESGHVCLTSCSNASLPPPPPPKLTIFTLLFNFALLVSIDNLNGNTLARSSVVYCSSIQRREVVPIPRVTYYSLSWNGFVSPQLAISPILAIYTFFYKENVYHRDK